MCLQVFHGVNEGILVIEAWLVDEWIYCTEWEEKQKQKTDLMMIVGDKCD